MTLLITVWVSSIEHVERDFCYNTVWVLFVVLMLSVIRSLHGLHHSVVCMFCVLQFYLFSLCFSVFPWCLMIAYVVQVLALGMIFIGVTMTLIAHWPGSTSIGENPLKVAGPVLLSVGVVALIIGIVLVGVVNTRERRRWQKQMARMIISRSCVLQSSLSLSLSRCTCCVLFTRYWRHPAVCL